MTGLKAKCRKSFDGSDDLFEACWRTLRSIWNATEITDDDAEDWLEQIAAEKVNNPRSSFHIYGQEL